MVMPLQVITTGGSYGVKLMIGEHAAKMLAGGLQGVAEAITRIVHLVDLEGGLQTAFVETGIVGNERKGGYQFLHVEECQLVREEHIRDTVFQLVPHNGEDRCFVRITLAQPVYPLAEIAVVVGLWLDEAVERVGYTAIAHHDRTHGADA